MNNGYNFIPNQSFMRSVPMYPNYGVPMPRMNSLFGKYTSPGNNTKVTFSGILNGASKTLGVINQAIPVFYQVKPIWNNARTMFKVVKGLNNVNANDTNSIDKKTSKTNVQEKKQTNAPTFFA